LKKKKESQKNSNQSSFSKEFEEAIRLYSTSKGGKEEHKEHLCSFLKKIVENVVKVYNFDSLPDIQSLKKQCKEWLFSSLCKFHIKRGSSAYMYFTICAKTWFIKQLKGLDR